MSTEYKKIFTYDFFLPASEVNAQRELPLSGLVTTIIDVATAHANHLDIGFDKMISRGISWVLSRLTIDVDEMPGVGRNYRMETWVESINRLFSERNFRLTDLESGKVLLKAHSVWMAINMETRRPGELTEVFAHLDDIIVPESFGGEKGAKLAPFDNAETETSYAFAVSDIDVNRHVTTRRYIDLITDIRPLQWYDAMRLARFEIAFKHEARYGQTAIVSSFASGEANERIDAQISVDATHCCIARLCFETRK